MKIKELQEKIADALNGVEELVQAGCTAIAEDSREVYNRADQLVQEGHVAIVVVTPEITRNGSNTDGTVPTETQLQIQCSEPPAVARALAESISKGLSPLIPVKIRTSQRAPPHSSSRFKQRQILAKDFPHRNLI